MAKQRPLEVRIAEAKRRLDGLDMRKKIRDLQDRERALKRRSSGRR